MIRLENVTKTYPKNVRPALDDVTLEIPRGQFAFVVGKSGSGKSTLLQLVIKEQDATSGEILVAGRVLSTLPLRKVAHLRREIGFVFQDFRLLPNKTVHQNVAYALQILGRSRTEIRQIVPETLELVGLAGKGKRLPHQLSGGEQQRVAIARAFVNRPKILLADEPTGNLDPATSLEIVQLLDRINHTGTTVVMATHDTATVNALRKRVIELSDGVLVRDDASGEYATGEQRLVTPDTAATAATTATTAAAATAQQEPASATQLPTEVYRPANARSAASASPSTATPTSTPTSTAEGS